MKGKCRLGAATCFLATLLVSAAAPASAQDLFTLSLEELLDIQIGVASRVSVDPNRQPATVTTISREQIRTSGARTLNELLMLHVPGYFLVEDQDDTIAAVRGLAPDNNSKIMLLLDGRNLNADWFWGPPDALLNGIDLEFIERIEVIRGPGSVTLGQGALLGVINLVTRRDPADVGHALTAVQGQHGRRGTSWRWTWQGEDERGAAVYVGDGAFDGEPIRNEGLARQSEQGLSVFERNHHLKRSHYRHVLAQYQQRDWHVDVYRFSHSRDLYNWRRDREQVDQQLTGIELGYQRELVRGELSIDGFHHSDDYALRTHGDSLTQAERSIAPDIIMGGHRELRTGLRLLWTSGRWLARHRLAAGMEYNLFRAGRADANGNNFIVNRQEDVFDRGYALLNSRNRWSLPGKTKVLSLFVEDFVTLGSRWEVFAAARYDAHPDWGSQVSPRLGALFQATERQLWRLSLQRGFRGAVGVHYHGGFEGDGLLSESNFEAIESNPYFAANGSANLRSVEPESLTSLELAWRFQPNQRWQLAATAFDNQLENVIGVGAYFLSDDAARAAALTEGTRIGTDLIGDWGGVFFFQNNDGELRHRGLEVEAEYRDAQRGIKLLASHAFVQVADADPGQFGPGNIYVTGSVSNPRSRSFPERSSRIRLDWRPPQLEGRFALSYLHLHYPSWVPPAVIDSTGHILAPELPGAHLGNLSLEWLPKQWPNLLATIQIKNLWNEDALYPATTVAGEESIGNTGAPAIERRSAWLTLRLAF